MCFFKKRPTKELTICALSGLLANEYCVETVKRRYYVDPRPGEPVPPIEACTVHGAPPEPIRVTVCTVSGKRPGPYCRSTAEREYEPGTEPTTICAVCVPVADPSFPRTGMDYYQIIPVDLALIAAYLDALVVAGGSLQRYFFDFTWPLNLAVAGWHFSPYKQVGWWVETGGEFEGQTFPLFTISRSDEYGEPWNEAIWDKWRIILGMCAERGIRVTLSIYDWCSLKHGDDKRHNPLMQNVQHHGADGFSEYTKMDGSIGRGYGIHTGGVYGGFGSEAGGAMKDFQLEMIKRIAAFVRSIPGLDYRIMPGNEMARPPEGTETMAEVDAILREWHEFWIDELKRCGVPEERIVVSISGPNTREGVTIPLKEKYPCIVEQIHGPNSPESMAGFSASYPGAEIDGDGFDPKAAGYKNEFGHKMPSIAQCRSMRQYMIAHGLAQYETFNGYTEGREWQDIGRAKWDEQRALSGKI
ncbi:MAG: hypothetical protein M0R66_07555 [Candidatus Omnitrophica bacterium]|nr:hypothetical protein [Candidatus Omnitrophota bacterium]